MWQPPLENIGQEIRVIKTERTRWSKDAHMPDRQTRTHKEHFWKWSKLLVMIWTRVHTLTIPFKNPLRSPKSKVRNFGAPLRCLLWERKTLPFPLRWARMIFPIVEGGGEEFDNEVEGHTKKGCKCAPGQTHDRGRWSQTRSTRVRLQTYTHDARRTTAPIDCRRHSGRKRMYGTVVWLLRLFVYTLAAGLARVDGDWEMVPLGSCVHACVWGSHQCDKLKKFPTQKIPFWRESSHFDSSFWLHLQSIPFRRQGKNKSINQLGCVWSPFSLSSSFLDAGVFLQKCICPFFFLYKPIFDLVSTCVDSTWPRTFLFPIRHQPFVELSHFRLNTRFR